MARDDYRTEIVLECGSHVEIRRAGAGVLMDMDGLTRGLSVSDARALAEALTKAAAWAKSVRDDQKGGR